MSSIVRSQLEQFISSERITIRTYLRDAKAEAVEKRNYDMLAVIEEVENVLVGFAPVKSAFSTPDEYIDALRSYAFILSLVSSLLRRIGVNAETLTLTKQLINLTSEKVELGKLIENAKTILCEKGYGREVFIDGCKTYVGLLVGKVKEFDKQELHIVKEALAEIFARGPPIRRFSDLARELGTREKDLMRIMKKIPAVDPNIIVRKSYVAVKDKLKEYIDSKLREKGYILIGEHAKDLLLEPKHIVEALKTIRDILPNLRIYDEKIAYEPSVLANYVERLVQEKIVMSYEELAAKLGVHPKLMDDILRDISSYVSETAVIGRVLINKPKLVSWLSNIIGDRLSIFVDEIAGVIGVDTKTARGIAELASILSRGDIIVNKNRMIYKPNISKALSVVIEEQKLPEEISILKETTPELVEDMIYQRVHQKLLSFEKMITGK